jgi:iron(III) transport system permease protein
VAGWIAVAAFVAVPLLRLAAGASGSAIGEVVADPRTAQALAGSLLTSAPAAVLATFLGTLFAYATERMAVPGRMVLRLLVLAPLIIPPFVSAISIELTYGPFGLLDALTGVRATWIEGPIGVALVIAVNAMPLAYLAAVAALASGSEVEAERAGRVSGASALRVFTTITLPMLRPAAAGGALLAFVFGLNSFGVPIVLGTPAGFDTLTTEVYRGLVRSADPAAFDRVVVLATVLAVLGLLTVLLLDRAGGTGVLAVRAGPSGGAVPAAPAKMAAAAIWGWSLLVVVIPVAGLVVRSLVPAPGVPPVPANWSLGNFVGLFDTRTLSALGRSTALAAIAAAGVLVLAGIGVAEGRVGRRGIGIAGALGYAVPGSALAVAVLLAYRVPLADTLAIILVAYLAKFWALGHRSLAGAAVRLGDDPLRAARASGASGFTLIRTVVVPSLAPALVAAGLLVFLFGLHELTMSSLLRGPGTDTLAVVVLDVQQLGDAGRTSALAVVLTLLVVAASVPLVAARRSWRRVTGT